MRRGRGPVRRPFFIPVTRRLHVDSPFNRVIRPFYQVRVGKACQKTTTMVDLVPSSCEGSAPSLAVQSGRNVRWKRVETEAGVGRPNADGRIDAKNFVEVI